MMKKVLITLMVACMAVSTSSYARFLTRHRSISDKNNPFKCTIRDGGTFYAKVTPDGNATGYCDYDAER